MSRRTVGLIALLSLCLVLPAAAQEPAAPAAGTKDHAAAVKESLQKSMAALRQYQWVETTAVSMKGEEKSRSQKNCFYGADGKVQKTPVAAAAAPAKDDKRSRGVKARAVENKTEEISDAVKEAIGLVKQYVPPDPARIQAAKDAGRVSVTPPDPAGQVRLVIKDYLKPGDSLTLDANAASDRISGLTVATFTEKAKDAVGLKVSFGAFADGTVYPSQIQLDVAAQNLAIAIENSGYRKVGS
ncbi:MAG TPA: hypothetical protein VGS03_11690 [Candidatus Polarisedimenticolia bacterium]|jgi:hypothetical protein|nr:hypothetical protein [Candidatus Polarisedimenticolia bacterium]